MYVSYFFDQYNKSRVDLLAGLLETMVEMNVLQAKYVNSLHAGQIYILEAIL